MGTKQVLNLPMGGVGVVNNSLALPVGFKVVYSLSRKYCNMTPRLRKTQPFHDSALLLNILYIVKGVPCRVHVAQN